MPLLICRPNDFHEKLAIKMAMASGKTHIVTSGNDEKVCELKHSLPYVVALEDASDGEKKRMAFSTDSVYWEGK